MRTYRVRLRPRSGFITFPKADTLFGGLCWSIRYRRGEDALQEFLDHYRRGNPPLVLSNALPGDLFPRPRIRLRPVAVGERTEMLRSLKEEKKVKRIAYLDAGEFHALRRGDVPPLRPKAEPFLSGFRLHDQIDRLSGRAAEEGGLHAEAEWHLDFRHYSYLSVYMKVADGFLDLILSGLEALGRTGMGKRKSVGKGSFEILDREEMTFDDLERANALISLSDFVPAAGDPTDGVYSLTLKYGKLAEEYALLHSPFKRPLVMFEAGSCFWIDGPGPASSGGWWRAWRPVCRRSCTTDWPSRSRHYLSDLRAHRTAVE